MPALMSFAKTWEAFKSGAKDVTRRGGVVDASWIAKGRIPLRLFGSPGIYYAEPECVLSHLAAGWETVDPYAGGWAHLKAGKIIEGVEWSPRSGPMWWCPKCGRRDSRLINLTSRACCARAVIHRPPERLPGQEGWRRVVSERWEALGEITTADVAREGFPGKSPGWFVEFYCAPKRPDPNLLVHRIEFERVKA
jgi:hypothetical protein